MARYQDSLKYAKSLDREDPLGRFRRRFHIPPGKIYLTGNSLGLQPRKAREYVERELGDWARLGVDGHLQAKNSWLSYHELLTASTARLVGAKPIEVVVMNTLTVNLHLMMVSFYRPTPKRFKILMEKGAFPSDRYAIDSQAAFHGHDPADAVLEVSPRPGEACLRPEDILAVIEREGAGIALILFGNVNYLTGQAFDMKAITAAGRRKGCRVGFDLAHGAGNLRLRLHDWGVDFAVWCGYKYLNAGPGALSGCFVHERHARNFSLPRFAGWWGHDKIERFKMRPRFDPIAGAEGWQLSNPPILPMAALRASLELFDEAGMDRLGEKSRLLTGYLEYLLRRLPAGAYEIITPKERGCQLSIKVRGDMRSLLKRLEKRSLVCDLRQPDILRAAPVPLYNRFEDVYRFVRGLEG